MEIMKSAFFLLIGLCFLGCNPKEEQKTPETVVMETGNPTINLLSEKITENPDDASLYAARAKAFYESKGYDEAIADLKKAISLDSTNITFFHLQADACLDYYKSYEALEVMKEAATRFPEDIPTLLKLSEYQLILKKHKASMQTLDRIFKIDPQNADAFFMLGICFRETGDEARAISSLQSAVEIDSDLIDAWILLGQMFDKRNNPIALKYFDNALRIDSLNTGALHSKATYYENRGQLKDAIAVYKKINVHNPQYAEAYFNTGILYLEMDSLDMAYKHFDIAVKTNPLYSIAYYYRGGVSEQKGDLDAALRDYNQTRSLSPGFERAETAIARLNKQMK